MFHYSSKWYAPQCFKIKSLIVSHLNCVRVHTERALYVKKALQFFQINTKYVHNELWNYHSFIMFSGTTELIFARPDLELANMVFKNDYYLGSLYFMNLEIQTRPRSGRSDLFRRPCFLLWTYYQRLIVQKHKFRSTIHKQMGSIITLITYTANVPQ